MRQYVDKLYRRPPAPGVDPVVVWLYEEIIRQRVVRQDISDRSGVDVKAVTDWISGRFEPRFDTLDAVVTSMGFRLDVERIPGWRTDPYVPFVHPRLGPNIFRPLVIPANLHPVIRKGFERINTLQIPLAEITRRSGQSRAVVSRWRNMYVPVLPHLTRFLTSVGLRLVVRRIKDDRIVEAGSEDFHCEGWNEASLRRMRKALDDGLDDDSFRERFGMPRNEAARYLREGHRKTDNRKKAA